MNPDNPQPPSEVVSNTLHGAPLGASDVTQLGQSSDQSDPPTPIIPSVMPAETNTVTPESPKKGSPLIMIAIILALVAILAVVAYVFGAKLLNIKPTPTPTLTPIVVVTPSPAPDVTASWKTFTSSCGFSVKYPDGWNAQKFFVQDSSDSCAFLMAPDYKQGSDTRTGFSITLTRLLKGNINQDTNYKASINTTDDYIKSIESLQQPLVSVKNKISATYGSLSGTQFDYDAFESTTTFIFLQNNYFWIIDWPTTSQYSGQYRESLDQILSTFQFVGATPSASPTPLATQQ